MAAARSVAARFARSAATTPADRSKADQRRGEEGHRRRLRHGSSVAYPDVEIGVRWVAASGHEREAVASLGADFVDQNNRVEIARKPGVGEGIGAIEVIGEVFHETRAVGIE